MDFFLQRLILIDSYSAGRIVEFPLEGGAVLTGRNGRGKTTLLQLIPIFYGESPNRLLDKGANRKSFTDYYLGRSTSYIVFEYRRRGQETRCVVLFADKQNELNYLFIRQAYDMSLFVQENNIIENINLAKSLKIKNISCSGRISSIQKYKQIIQGIASNTPDKQEKLQIKALIADYAFTSSQPLKHIEKIVSGMFKRRTHFDDLQMMVVDCIGDNQQHTKLTLDRAKIEKWPQDYQAYQAVMAKQSTMNEALARNEHYLAAEQEMRVLHGQCLSWLNYQEQQSQQLQTAHNTLSRDKIDQELFSEGEIKKYQLDIQQLQQQAEYSHKQAQELEKQQQCYQQQNMDEKEAFARQAPDFRQDLTSLEQRLNGVLGEQQQVKLDYQKYELEAQEAYQLKENQRNQQQMELQKEHYQQSHHLQVAYQQNKETSKQQIEQHKLALQPQIALLNQGLGHYKFLVQFAQATPQVLQQVQDKEQVLNEQHSYIQQLEQKLKTREQQQNKLSQTFNQTEQRIEKQKNAVINLEKEQQRLQELATPPADSLLAFLRQEYPQWQQDIAKVINEELLLNTQLNPQLVEISDSFYGLSLDLSWVLPLASANNQQAQQDLETINQQLTEAQIPLKQSEQQLKQLAKDKEQFDKQLRQQAAELKIQQDKLANAQKELAQAKQQAQMSQQQQKQQAQVQLTQIEAQKKQLEQQLKGFDEELKQQELNLNTDYQHQVQQLGAQQKQAIVELEQQQKSLKEKLAEKRQELRQQCDEILASHGVNLDISRQLEQDIQTTKQKLKEINDSLPFIDQWKRWLENQWPQHKGYQQQVKGYQQKIQQQQQDFVSYRQQAQQQLVVLTTQISELKAQSEKLTEQISLLNSQNQKLFSVYTWSAQLPVYDAIWTAETLLLRAKHQATQLAKYKDNLTKLMREIRKPFYDYPNHTPYQYLENQPYQEDERDGLDILALWYSENHQQMLSLLINEASSIINLVVSFKQLLDDFHLKIQQFNRELQQSFDDSAHFDSFNQLEVKVISKIKELEYWQAIDEVSKTHQTWSFSSNQQLPPANFVDTLQQLLNHWELKAGIQADLKQLIRIEGSVVENQQKRIFKKAGDLETISSNGLSYLILCNIFVAFINRIRKNKNIAIVWALDELKDLDSANVSRLLELLKQHNISLACAFPDPDNETLVQFKHCFSVEPDRRLAQVQPFIFESEFSHV